MYMFIDVHTFTVPQKHVHTRYQNTYTLFMHIGGGLGRRLTIFKNRCLRQNSFLHLKVKDVRIAFDMKHILTRTITKGD